MPPTRDLLLKAKCKALVRARWGDVVDGAVEAALPGGAALAAADGRTAWVLAEDDPARALGGALAWVGKAAPDAALHLLATGGTGLLARRAERFRRPITVWRVDGTALMEAPPEPLVPEPPLDDDLEPFRLLIERSGAEPVLEAGVLRAEVRGLEVARVVRDDEGMPSLAVGVGKHDREAQQELRGTDQGFDELFEVVRQVAQARVAGGEGHAAYHLAGERWLRSVLVRRPELVGASSLRPAPSPIVRDDLRMAAPAPAAGEAEDGSPLLVVCSVGVDLDLVPGAVDAWLADGREPRLVVCVPEGDAPRSVAQLVDDLTVDAALTTVPRDWRTL